MLEIYRWLWLHESWKFRSYEDQAIFLIENSYIEYLNNNKDSIVLIQWCNNMTYKIDFTTFLQYNENTEFAREINREDV